MAKLTKAQRTRLDKLATYLEGLPADYSHFDMSDYLDVSKYSDAAIKYARENGGVASCGTAACAVGHGPAAGVLFPPRLRNEYVNWDRYAELFVGKLHDYSGGGRRYRWCFGGEWADRDNGHFGAAARIRYLLEHGRPPVGYRDPTRELVALYAPYRIDAKTPANA